MNERLQHLVQKLNGYDSSTKSVWLDREINIFQSFSAQDIVGKRHITSLFSPSSINVDRKDLSPLQFDQAIKKIVICNAKVSDVKKANSQNL